MEAVVGGLKVPKGSFKSLQKSLLGLHGSSNGSCSEASEAFESAKGQFRKPKKSLLGLQAAARPWKVPKGSFESLQKSLLGLHGGSNGSCSEGFEGAKGQFRKPTKKLAGPARRQ